MAATSAARVEERNEAPPPGPHILVSLATAAIFPFDRILAGLIGAGLGVEAVCAYLSLSRAALDDSVVRLGLRTPTDHPLRKRGAKAWSIQDVICLIAWRVAGIHPETIGQRLRRSTGAVRAKCRRLGIPAPDRKTLRRCNPSTLREPIAGFTVNSQNYTSTDRCGTPAGPVVNHPHLQKTGSDSPFATTDDPPLGKNKRKSRGVCAQPGQREMPFFGIARDTRVEPALSTPLSGPAIQPIEPAVVSPSAPPVAAVDQTFGFSPSNASQAQADLPLVDLAPFKQDLAWVQARSDWRRDKEVIMALILPYFSGQHYTKVAARAGITEGTLQSFWYHLEMPRDLHRSKFGDEYDEAVARFNFEQSGYHLALCKKSAMFFFRRNRDRATVTICRTARRKLGLLEEFDRYKSPELCLDVGSRKPKGGGWQDHSQIAPSGLSFQRAR